jgi:hypothetical protein
VQEKSAAVAVDTVLVAHLANAVLGKTLIRRGS